MRPCAERTSIMEITREQVEHVAKLARLAIGEEEKVLFARQLS